MKAIWHSVLSSFYSQPLNDACRAPGLIDPSFLVTLSQTRFWVAAPKLFVTQLGTISLCITVSVGLRQLVRKGLLLHSASRKIAAMALWSGENRVQIVPTTHLSSPSDEGLENTEDEL